MSLATIEPVTPVATEPVGYWKATVVLVIVMLALLRSVPAYEALNTSFVKATWQAAQVKFDHPLTDMAKAFPPASHEAKLTYRITVPLVVYVFRLGPRQVLAMNAALGVLLLYLVLGLAHRITGDRVVAVMVCVAVACCWPGQTAFHEYRGGYYDVLALCLLLLAMSARTPMAVASWTFLAGWTDERALIALPLLLLAGADRRRREAMFNAGAVSLLLRALLATFYSTPGAGVGPAVFVSQMATVPLGLWTGLGGGWILVVWSLFSLQHPVVLATAVGLLAGVAAMVVGITRSAAYCLPAVFVALAILKHHPRLRAVAVLAACVSVVLPSFYVEGLSVYWLRY